MDEGANQVGKMLLTLWPLMRFLSEQLVESVCETQSPEVLLDERMGRKTLAIPPLCLENHLSVCAHLRPETRHTPDGVLVQFWNVNRL